MIRQRPEADAGQAQIEKCWSITVSDAQFPSPHSLTDWIPASPIERIPRLLLFPYQAAGFGWLTS